MPAETTRWTTYAQQSKMVNCAFLFASEKLTHLLYGIIPIRNYPITFTKFFVLLSWLDKNIHQHWCGFASQLSQRHIHVFYVFPPMGTTKVFHIYVAYCIWVCFVHSWVYLLKSKRIFAWFASFVCWSESCRRLELKREFRFARGRYVHSSVFLRFFKYFSCEQSVMLRNASCGACFSLKEPNWRFPK